MKVLVIAGARHNCAKIVDWPDNLPLPPIGTGFSVEDSEIMEVRDASIFLDTLANDGAEYGFTPENWGGQEFRVVIHTEISSKHNAVRMLIEVCGFSPAKASATFHEVLRPM